MIIDFHTHIFSPRVRDNRDAYLKQDPCFAMMYSSPRAKLATAGELIESMDRDEVDISVVLNIAWTRNELCLETNDYILESVSRFPKRLVAFATVPPNSTEAVREIERCARAGARGIGEMRLEAGDEQKMAGVIESVISHKLILLTHASEPLGHRYPGKGKSTPEALYPLFNGFPDLVAVCAHWGGGLPFYALMPEVKIAMANVYFDSAASPFLYQPQIYCKVGELIGADKVLFGSDYPLIPQRRVIAEIKSQALPEEEMILGGNASRLLGIR